MLWLFLAALTIAVALIKLGIATVMVSVLAKLLTASLAFIALLCGALLWQSWRHRR